MQCFNEVVINKVVEDLSHLYCSVGHSLTAPWKDLVGGNVPILHGFTLVHSITWRLTGKLWASGCGRLGPCIIKRDAGFLAESRGWWQSHRGIVESFWFTVHLHIHCL